MATNTEQREADYTCPVCCDIFTDPVLLLCGHSFCQHCLQEWWRQSKLRTCPVCKETFPMTRPPRNLALRNLSDSLRQERSRSTFKLRNQLRKNKNPYNNNIFCFPPKSAPPQIQAQQTEKTIRAEFQKLYQFLRAEEAGRIDACRKEAKLKSGPVNLQLVNLTAEISELVKKTKTIEDEMRKDDLSFMLNARTTLQGFLSKQQETETPTGTLMDEAKHISNLQFSVWKKMTDTVQYTPVTLDRNTSCRSLAILDNLTKSRVFYLQAFDFPSISDTPERLGDSDILGYQGLNSGENIGGRK
ncbi:E3 ubiquitin-protein ligase TRIM35-like [Fundulus diaphanus]